MNNINKKERILIIVLVILVIWGLGVSLLVFPAYQSLLDKGIDLVDVVAQQNNINQKISASGSLDDELNKLHQQSIENEDAFFPDMIHYEVSSMIRSLFTTRKLQVESVNISDKQNLKLAINKPIDIQTDTSTETTTGDAQTPPQPTEIEVIGYTVSVQYAGDYANVKSLVDDIYILNKTIYVSNITINDIDGSNDKKTGGIVNLTVYLMPPNTAQ